MMKKRDKIAYILIWISLAFLFILKTDMFELPSIKEIPYLSSDIEVIDQPYSFLNAEQNPVTADTVTSYYIQTNSDTNYRRGYNTGTNPRLEGEQTVVLFFMSDNESSWDAETIQNFTKKNVLPALEWIEREAKNGEYKSILRFGGIRPHFPMALPYIMTVLSHRIIMNRMQRKICFIKQLGQSDILLIWK